MDAAQIFFDISELSTPRPNGSRALECTVDAVKAWLEDKSITVDGLLPGGTPQLAIRWLAVLTTLPVAAYGLGMGFHLVGGRLSSNPSRGAVDNGAAVAVLLAMAHRLKQGNLRQDHTSVTLLFTVGEEAQMQGALAYVRDRKAWPLPTAVINLEVVGQNGRFLLWDQDGTAMLRLPNNRDLNLALSGAVRAVTGKPAVQAPRISSDAFAFLRQGVMATTLGSLDAELEDGGLHSAKDKPSRIDPQRLTKTVEVLSRFLADLDAIRGRSQN